MKILGRKVALAIGAGVLGVGLLGGAAFAALAPAGGDGAAATVDTPFGAVQLDKRGPDKLKAILDDLVAKGTITAAQRDAILDALHKTAVKDRELAAIFRGLFKDAATYLGISEKDLRAQLPGKSLADVAGATTGKSRDGLVTALTADVNTTIGKLLADGKITKDQADTAKAGAPARIATFVDHTWPTPSPKNAPRGLAVMGDLMATTRTYLGLTQRDVMKALQDGKSLGDLANATPGKARDGLVTALTTAANARIDQLQKDGKLTADQATAAKAKVATQVAAFVDHKGLGRTSKPGTGSTH